MKVKCNYCEYQIYSGIVGNDVDKKVADIGVRLLKHIKESHKYEYGKLAADLALLADVVVSYRILQECDCTGEKDIESQIEQAGEMLMENLFGEEDEEEESLEMGLTEEKERSKVEIT